MNYFTKMKTNYLFKLIFFFCCVLLVSASFSQPAYREIGLTDKSAFTGNTIDWKIAGDIWYNPFKNKMKEEAGTGILVNSSIGNRENPLITVMEHGNLALDLDFMLAPGSSATLYLQGRYGISLTDSWAGKTSSIQDCGTILSDHLEADAGGKISTLKALPRSNLARAPGLWQHLRIVFQAPQFEANGNKKNNARLVQVALNGTLIHEDIQLPGAASGAPFKDESKTGPIVLSSGSRVAIKNIRYASFSDAEADKVRIPVPVPVSGRIPLIVTPADRTIVQRCFLGEGDRKLTVCAVVGEPEQIHYGVNLEQGAVIRLWKGDFIDATTMWEGRGALQLARPLGSVIRLPSEPMFAHLADSRTAWPEFMQQGFAFKGYVLDKSDRPTFYYTFNGGQIADRTVPSEDYRALTRTVQFENKAVESDLWIRLAAGDTIEKLEDGLYAVNHKSYYIRLDSKRQRGSVLRSINGKQELLIPASAVSGVGLTWSYIW